jgi:hypothetical protein
MAEVSPKPEADGSPADTPSSSKGAASKDKKCPFCQQPFTSSSLGRHLDLYIKEKNPKAPDGVHNVDEIKKLRGSITRRVPRSKSMGSAGSPSVSATPHPQMPTPNMNGTSGSLRRSPVPISVTRAQAPLIGIRLNEATWETTGIIRNLPPQGMRTPEKRRQCSTSYNAAQIKNGQKRTRGASQTSQDEQRDEAKATELALRQLLESMRVAT